MIEAKPGRKQPHGLEAAKTRPPLTAIRDTIPLAPLTGLLLEERRAQILAAKND